MKVGFVKMHGADNDFVLIDDREGRFPVDQTHIAALANRPNGVGCEGVILLRRSETADFAMRFFNPDGTEAELCGNGARCVAAFARAVGAVSSPRMRFETLAGPIEAEVLDATRVRVVMPTPKDLRVDFVNSGVPHRIVPVADLSSVNVDEEGRRIRYSDEFAPAGTNVDFVTFRPPHEVDIRTYERGVEAESGACGTGAVAAAVVGVAQHCMRFPVQVKTVGGHVLEIDGELDGDSFRRVTLTGPVRRVFEGVIDV